LFVCYLDGLTDVIIYNVPDDPKKKNRGFTFLDFDCHKTAAAAKKRLATCRVFGCDIIVDWADPLEEPDEETMSKVLAFIQHLTFNPHVPAVCRESFFHLRTHMQMTFLSY